MLIQLPGVLTDNQLQEVTRLLQDAPFVDGRLSAGDAARQVKNNEEVDVQSDRIQALNNIVMGSLVQHPLYASAALPHRVAVPYYARYKPGMFYGDHVDDPVMGPANARYRSDVSISVFLNEPDSYEGGELMIRTPFGNRSVKLAAGDAVLYPSSSLHHVAEVTKGERLVAVTWVQSLIADPAKRELLFELDQAREALMRDAPDSEATAQVNRSWNNLIRMWSEV